MTNSQRPAVTVNAHILESMENYLSRNALDERAGVAMLNRKQELYRARDSVSDYIEAPASETDRTQKYPRSIIVNYDHPVCPILLPAGREVRIGQIAGHVSAVEAFTPLEPMTWDEMQAEAARWIALLDSSGWVRSASYFTPSQGIHENITAADFARFPGHVPKWVYVGFWEQCDNPGIKVSVQVRHYNSSSSGSFIPPAPLAKPLNPFAEDKFLMLIHFFVESDSPIEHELTLLRNARRIEINGDPQKPIPLATWLDDPDWRPEGWEGEYIK